jgi:hypothetical protein
MMNDCSTAWPEHARDLGEIGAYNRGRDVKLFAWFFGAKTRFGIVSRSAATVSSGQLLL